MAVNDKLEQWKTDFRASDTNTPNNESIIGAELGTELRALKQISRKDLANTQDLSSASTITYTNKAQATPDASTGKPYSLYKSVSLQEIEANANVDKNMLANSLVEATAATTLVGNSFQILGNWSSLLYPGTPLCVSSDGQEKYAHLEVLAALPNQNANSGYEVYGSATKIVFHPKLVPFPRANETCASNVSFDFVYGGGLNLTLLELKVVNGNTGNFTCAVIKGRRIEIIRMDKTSSRGSDYPDNAANIVEYYPNGSFTVVMNGDVRQDGNDLYIGLYRHARKMAQDIDGLSQEDAEELFPSSANPLEEGANLGPECVSNLEDYWTPSDGAGATTTDSVKYVMRMSNETFLTNPENALETISAPNSASYLIGTQNGNRDINGQAHDSVCYTVVVSNIGQNDVLSFEYYTPGTLRYPPGNKPLISSVKGNEFRATITCVNVADADENFVLTPDIAKPVILGNSWSTSSGSSWNQVPENSPRDGGRFSLKFRKAFQATITYEVTVFNPVLNGKTLYQN